MLVDTQGVPTQEFWDIIDSPSRDHYCTIDQFCKAQKVDAPSNQLQILKESLEISILERLRYVSLFEFFAMQKSGNWGSAGEYQIRLSMMGHFLEKHAGDTLQIKDQDTFGKLLDEYYEKLNIRVVDEKDLHVLSKNFTFDFFGRSISNSDLSTINRLLAFLGSRNSIYISSFENAKRFIYGEARTYSISNHDIFCFTKELCRSPHFIMAEAACSGDRDVLVRQESLETVFHQKWVPVLDTTSNAFFSEYDKPRVISEQIKRKALSSLGISSKEELLSKKDEFLKIMGETIIYHELGHVVVQNDILPKDIGPVAEGTKSLGYEVFLSMVELLADFAPSYNNLHGSIKQIYKVSKKSPQKATAMFYIYLSDVWFFDTQDTYMFLYSELVMFAMMRYINPDQTINFEKINYDIHFDKRRKVENKDTKRFVNFLFALLIKETRTLYELLTNSIFKLEDQTHTLQSLKALINLIFQKNNPSIDSNSYDYKASQYSYIFMTAKKAIWPEDALSHQVKTSENKIRAAMVRLYSRDKTRTLSSETAREIIYKKMTALGFALN